MRTQKSCALLIFESMNRREFSELEPLVSEQLAFDFPGAGIVTGRKRVLIFLKALLRKYPRLLFTVHECIAEKDRVCVVWENEGRSASGQEYANRGVTVVHFENGLISLISDYFKDTSFAQDVQGAGGI